MPVIYVSASGSDSYDGLSMGFPKLTPRAAQIAATSNGKVLLKAGECFGPSSGGLFFFINGTDGIEIGTYGTASDKPILDALTYQNPGVSGWTYISSGIWKKVFAATYIRRLWAGSTSLGDLVSQRVVGTAYRRATHASILGTATAANPSEATILSMLGPADIWFGGGAATSYALYVYTGSGTIDPPTYYGGLAFIQSNGSSVGAVEGIIIRGRQGIHVHDVHFRGNGSCGMRLMTQNSDAADTKDCLFEDITVTCPYNGGIISRISGETTPLYRCKSSTFRRVYVDYWSSPYEQEPNTTYGYLSGISDLFNVADGSIGITVDKCTGINSAHNGIVTGSVNMVTAPPVGCLVTNNTIRYDAWHTYARGMSSWGSDTIFRGNLLDGQNTRTQISGAAQVVGNIWINMRNCIRKASVAQGIAVESYIFDSANTGIGTERYIYIQPTNVLIAHNTFYGTIDATIGMHFYGTQPGSNDNTFGAATVTVQNNISMNPLAKFAQTYEDSGKVIGQQTIKKNIIYNGLTGDSKHLWRGTSYTLNAIPGGSGNLETHPQLDSDHRPQAGSPCLGNAQAIYPPIRDYNGTHILKAAPDIGAVQKYTANTPATSRAARTSANVSATRTVATRRSIAA